MAKRLLIIGCGAIVEQFYLPALLKCRSAISRVVLADKEPRRLEVMRSLISGSETVTDFRGVLETVDCAIVATPPDSHAKIGVQCLNARCRTLVEKPLANSAAEGAELVRAARASGCALLVNNMRRLHAVNRYVFSLVHGRQFGSLKKISYIEGGEFSWPSVSGFYFNPPDRRGILSDRGSHILDLICWWMGEKPRLVSALDDSLGGVEGVCEVRLQGSSVEAFVKINWHNKMKNRVEVMFEHAKVEFEVYEYRRCLVTDLGTGAKRTVLAPGWKLDPATQLLGDLLTDGEDGREPAVSGADVLPSLELIDEYYLMRRPLPMEWMKGLQP